MSNTGALKGDEVVQLYVAYPASTTLVRSTKRLIGFKRITLAVGEEKTVTFNISATSLATWDNSTTSYRTPSGNVHLMAGSSSTDTATGLDINVL